MRDEARRQFLGMLASGAAAPLVGGLSPFSAGVSGEHDRTDSQVPWLGEIQRDREAAFGDRLDLAPLIQEGDDGAHSRLDWKARREQIKSRWAEYLGLLPTRRPPLGMTVVEQDRPPGVVRQLIEYQNAPGEKAHGYLLRPAFRSEKRPGIVALHSTVDHTIRQPAGIEGAPEKAFGLRLAQLGYVTFCPECYLWRDRNGRSFKKQAKRFMQTHPGSRGMAKMIYDARRGLDVLQSLPYVDEHRLGGVGHSLGAKEVLYLAAFDKRVRVTVSSEGGIGTTFSNWEAPWYLGSDIRSFDHEHHELLGLIAPRPFLLIGGGHADGRRSWPFIEAVLSVYRLYGEEAPVGLLNHGAGHTVPRVAEHRISQWFLTYL